ncbi:MAG: hypothetical protein ACT4P9_04500 [Betaproteobacteria bacterium]
MSISPRTDLARIAASVGAAVFALFLHGCGDKVPQSEAAKSVGEHPKQVLNKVEADVNKALQQGIGQRQQAEKKE